MVLSHWHLDHIAGTAVFEDAEIIACEPTAEPMTRHREAIERGVPPRARALPGSGPRENVETLLRDGG